MSTAHATLTKADFVRSHAVETTRSLLARQGLQVTMDQIADSSGISRRSLFRYFDSRDALVREAIESAIADYEAALASEATVDGELDQWLVRVIGHTHRSHLAAGLAIWQLTSTADDQLPADLRQINERRRAMRRRATQLLSERAWEAGGGTGAPPDVVTEAFAMALSGYATRSLVVDLAQPIEEVALLSASIIASVIETNRRKPAP